MKTCNRKLLATIIFYLHNFSQSAIIASSSVMFALLTKQCLPSLRTHQTVKFTVGLRNLLQLSSTAAPVIAFLPWQHENSTSNILPVIQTQYGSPASIPINPCAAENSTDKCGAVALDSTGNPISERIVAVDVSPCPVDQSCPACDITFANAGLCPPGECHILSL